ncbi:MAG TPA: peptide synthetase [Acidimicrobiaceae bacterium]|nr:peptide synthetase [Acidimicrobiaceae bacterium]
MEIEVRKVVSVVETTSREMGRVVDGLRRKVATAVVLTNPYAGRYVDDLSELVAMGADLGRLLVEEALAALGRPAEEVSAYGKAAVVGTAGEIEHAAALIHPTFGAPVRAALGRGPAIIPSTKLLGGPGTRVVAPLTNCNDIWQFDEMDAISISVDDAPRPDEVMAVLALGVGGRPLHRIGVPS